LPWSFNPPSAGFLLETRMVRRSIAVLVLSMALLCPASAQQEELPEYTTVRTAEFVAVLRDYVRLLRLEEQMVTARCL
jgi:hypothetical protein